MTIDEAIKDYLDTRRVEGCSPQTLESLQGRLELLARYFTKRRISNVTEVKPQDLDAYGAGLARRNASFGTRCAYMSTARVFFRWLYKRGKVLADPARDVVLLDEDEAPLPESPLTEDEISGILDGMPRRGVVDLRNRLHLELLYSCGLRITESLDLKLSDIDFQSKSMRVQGKGGKVRVLPLMKGTLGALKDYLALRRSLLKGPDTGVLLLAQRNGGKLSESSIYAILRRLCKKQKISRRLHPHLFRHSIAVHLLQRGADVRHVQEFLGHASIDTTKIYLRLVPGRLREDYDKAMPEIAV